MVKRFDSGRLSGARITSQGYLKARAIATRTGVFTYHFADGSVRRELRLPQEVFHPDTIETLQNIPVTLDHPSGMLNAENTHEFARGYTGDHVDCVEDRLVECTVTLTHKDAIEAVMKGGKDQLSLGYHCDLEARAGEWQGERYDAIQRKIRHNHLAIVERGRAGPEAKIRLDADSAVSSEEPTHNQEGHTMKIKIGNTELEVSDAAGVLISQQMKQDGDAIAELTGKLASGKGELEKIQGKLDSANETIAARDKEIKEHKDAQPDRAALRKMFKQRLELEELARAVCDEKDCEKLDAMDDLDIKKAVILAERPEAKLDGKSADYLSGRFEDIADQIRARGQDDRDHRDDSSSSSDDSSNDQFSRSVTGVKKGEHQDRMDPDKARMKAREDARNRWRMPLSATKSREGSAQA